MRIHRHPYQRAQVCLMVFQQFMDYSKDGNALVRTTELCGSGFALKLIWFQNTGIRVIRKVLRKNALIDVKVARRTHESMTTGRTEGRNTKTSDQMSSVCCIVGLSHIQRLRHRRDLLILWDMDILTHKRQRQGRERALRERRPATRLERANVASTRVATRRIAPRLES